MAGMDLISIKDKIASNVYSVINKRKSRSKVWDTFSVIKDDNNEIVQMFAHSI